MLPRYVPAVDARAWLTLLPGGAGEHDPDVGKALAIPKASFPHRTAFYRLREGMLLWFRELRARKGAGAVLMPVQICPAVPLAAREAGLGVRFVDIDSEFPTPSAAQYAGCLSPSTVAVVIRRRFSRGLVTIALTIALTLPVEVVLLEALATSDTETAVFE